MKIFKQLFVTIGFFLFVPLYSWSLDCEIQGVARCPFCDASMSLTCDNSYSGFVKNKTNPTSVTFSAMDKSTGEARTFTLSNPKLGARSYYAGLDDNPEVLRAMMRAGLGFSDNTELMVNKFEFSDDLQLFEDVDAQQSAKKPSGNQSEAQRKYACTWSETPFVISSSSCSRNICIGSGSCQDMNTRQSFDTKLFCYSMGDRCPSANDCALDDNVGLDSSKGIGQDGEYNPSGRGTGSRQ